MEIAPTLEAVRDISLDLERRLREAGVEESALADMNLAFVEAANNVVVHGGRGEALKMRVRLRIAADSVELELIDTGAPIPAEVLAADEPDDPFAESGRGLALIRACVDDMSYSSAAGVNRMRLVRALPGR
jgi:serine/threonine-protein kinase RsbW